MTINEKLLTLAAMGATNIHVNLGIFTGKWSASARFRKNDNSVELSISGKDSPDEAVNELYAKVSGPAPLSLT